LLVTNPRRCRIEGGGRKVTSTTLEELLAEEIRSMRLSGRRVSRRQIVQMGKTLAYELDVAESLNFSSGWLVSFMERNDFSLRRVTSKWTIKGEEVVRRAVSFLANVRASAVDFPLDRIIAFDETAICPCACARTTVDEVGKSHVSILGSSLEKFRITAIFACSASGRRHKPCFLVHSVCETPALERFPTYIVIRCKNAWISNAVMKLYLDWLFPPLMCFAPSMLIIDSARPHISIATKQLLHSKRISLKVIPGGTTSVLQPADVCHFAKLKALVQPRIDSWLTDPPDLSTLTRGGNRRAPKVEVYSTWLIEAWDSFEGAFLSESFQTCILGNIPDLYISRHDDFGVLFLQEWNSTVTNVTAVTTDPEEIPDLGDIDDDSQEE
jgi:hypothetical protein